MSGWDSSYWNAERDDALSGRPIILPCDQCGQDYPVADDEPIEDVRLCLKCARALERERRQTNQPHEAA